MLQLVPQVPPLQVDAFGMTQPLPEGRSKASFQAQKLKPLSNTAPPPPSEPGPHHTIQPPFCTVIGQSHQTGVSLEPHSLGQSGKYL